MTPAAESVRFAELPLLDPESPVARAIHAVLVARGPRPIRSARLGGWPC